MLTKLWSQTQVLASGHTDFVIMSHHLGFTEFAIAKQECLPKEGFESAAPSAGDPQPCAFTPLLGKSQHFLPRNTRNMMSQPSLFPTVSCGLLG